VLHYNEDFGKIDVHQHLIIVKQFLHDHNMKQHVFFGS
jgi:hypothetical protein